MRKIITFFLLFTLIFGTTFAQEKRKKIGLVLSGGGAKGAAHIGALNIGNVFLTAYAGVIVNDIVWYNLGVYLKEKHNQIYRSHTEWQPVQRN